jgi:hypothetical protein
MTREEFIREYAAGSDFLAPYASLGFIDFGYSQRMIKLALPCACGEDGCKGWAMISPDCVDSHLQLYAPEPLRSAYRAAIA